MSISDRVGIMRDGQLIQIDQPRKLYDEPAEAFVAKFFGKVNLIEVQPISSRRIRLWDKEFDTSPSSPRIGVGGRTWALIRPESIFETAVGDGAEGVIEDISFLGPLTQLQLRLNEKTTVNMTSSSKKVAGKVPGDQIWVGIDAQEIFVTVS
jgi:ABC-type Fe3+/spermidine/putrescine transport system ATPase subunit